jgi:hypothetical protein
VTFAKFGTPCSLSRGARANTSDAAISGVPDMHPDGWAPMRTKSIKKIDVDDQSLIRLPDPLASWINGGEETYCRLGFS